MNFDCIIIGGGLAGLTCGLKCLGEGLTCAIISSGMSALHFSSGSIDLLGYQSDQSVVYSPLEVFERFVEHRPEHPYHKVDPDLVYEALAFIQAEAAQGGLSLYAQGRDNHFHLTTLGALRPTYLSPKSVFNQELTSRSKRQRKIGLLNIKGFRDFYPELAAANLARHPLFQDWTFVTGAIDLVDLNPMRGNPHEFRSIDIARLFDAEEIRREIADQIKKIAAGADFVYLPAFIGLHRSNQVLQDLQDLTGLTIYEIPTLPPSIPGMRLDEALKSRFFAGGGVFIAGDRVIGGEIANGLLDHVHTQNYGDMRLTARHFVLASGSFFSGGLISEFETMREPIFGLPLDFSPKRTAWSSPAFFQPDGHPFLTYGVKTNRRLNPWDRSGRIVDNLYCAGAVLAGYNPIQEGSGGGVAVSTGYLAAAQIARPQDLRANG